MKKCGAFVSTMLDAEGRGCSCSVLVSQAPADPGGWVVNLFALFEGEPPALVRQITITTVTATDYGTRVAAVCSIPGSIGYSAEVIPPPNAVPIEVALYCSDVPAYAPGGVVP